MTFDIGLREVCVRVGGRAGVRYVITKFSRLDSLPNILTHGAPLPTRFARESSAIKPPSRDPSRATLEPSPPFRTGKIIIYVSSNLHKLYFFTT